MIIMTAVAIILLIVMLRGIKESVRAAVVSKLQRFLYLGSDTDGAISLQKGLSVARSKVSL